MSRKYIQLKANLPHSLEEKDTCYRGTGLLPQDSVSHRFLLTMARKLRVLFSTSCKLTTTALVLAPMLYMYYASLRPRGESLHGHLVPRYRSIKATSAALSQTADNSEAPMTQSEEWAPSASVEHLGTGHALCVTQMDFSAVSRPNGAFVLCTELLTIFPLGATKLILRNEMT